MKRARPTPPTAPTPTVGWLTIGGTVDPVTTLYLREDQETVVAQLQIVDRLLDLPAVTALVSHLEATLRAAMTPLQSQQRIESGHLTVSRGGLS